jgi:hypothetical protein
MIGPSRQLGSDRSVNARTTAYVLIANVVLILAYLAYFRG